MNAFSLRRLIGADAGVVDLPTDVPYTLVYPPTMLWKNFQRPQHLMTQLARRHGVRCLFNDWTVGEERLEDGKLVVTKRAFRRRYHHRPLVYYFSVPETRSFIRTRRLRPELVVFELMDLPAEQFRGWTETLPQALTRADIVRTTHPAITDYLLREHGDALGDTPITTSRNGVDLELFDPDEPRPAPAELADVTRPILGFYGNLDGWIDWALLGRLAALPDVQVVVIGDTENRPDQIPAELLRTDIRWLGRKPVTEIPAYLARFSACLFPFVVNEMTDAVDPLKVWEYFAFGQPVIATPTGFVRDRAELFHVADGSRALAEVVASALADGRAGPAADARRSAARSRDWASIASELHLEIVEALGRKR